MIKPEEKVEEILNKFKANDYDWTASGNDYVVKQHAMVLVREQLIELRKSLIACAGSSSVAHILHRIKYWKTVENIIKN